MNKKKIDDLSYNIIGAAIEVHKELGTGLLESVYQQCLKQELLIRGITFENEFEIPIFYKGNNLKATFKCDFYIENSLIVEIKAVTEIHPVHEAQLLTYMKLLKSPKGLLINFHCGNIFKEGQKTFVNEYYKKLPSI